MGFVVNTLLVLAVGVASGYSLPLICYYEGWSPYRNEPDRGHPSQIPVDDACTHIVYTFMGLDESNNKVRLLDPWQDVDKGAMREFVGLKIGRPYLKATFAIGGWNEGSEKYSKMASSDAGRKAFALSILELIETYGFDGVDLDWEYPAKRGGAPVDRENFALLLQEIRNTIGNERLLTIAVSANSYDTDAEYDIPRISKMVDYIHVMTYDLRGVWDGVVGNHAVLDATDYDKGTLRNITVRLGMKGWVDRGAPREKLILGMGLYGRTFTTQSSAADAIGSVTYSAGNAGYISQTAGTLFYSEICRKIKNEGYTVVFEEQGKVPHAYKGNQWIGYDNLDGFKYKTDLIKSEGYAGAMIWAIGQDDVSGACGEGKFPLIHGISNLLNGDDQQRISTPEPTLAPSNPDTSSSSELPSKTTEASHSSPIPQPLTSGEETDVTGQPIHCTKTTYPHKTSCKHFYLCDESRTEKLVEQSCPTGLVFNKVAGVCDWAINTVPSPADCPDFE